VRCGGEDNRVLRLALLEEWGWRCYWQGEPLTVSTAQIDHLIARTVSAARLAELIGLHQLFTGFDLHGPENLVPICGPCNNKKSNGDYLEAPAVSAYLVKAGRLAHRIRRRVQDHATTVAVGRALTAAIADLTRPQTRAEFLKHAPAVVQTLALLDEKRTGYWSPHSFDYHRGGGAPQPRASMSATTPGGGPTRPRRPQARFADPVGPGWTAPSGGR
jgi:hypothetical protein